MDLKPEYPYDKTSFNAYISCMYYIKTIEEEEKRAEKIEEGAEASAEETSDIGNLREEYENKVQAISAYPEKLEEDAKIVIEENTNKLNGYKTGAEAAENVAKSAYKSLEDVKTELKKVKTAFDKWENANNELKNAGKDTKSMDEDVKKYRDFFYSSNGNANADLEDIESLLSDVQENQNYFHKLPDGLIKEKFWDQSIATVPEKDQLTYYADRAEKALSGLKNCGDFSELEHIRVNEYIKHYEHVDILSEAGVSKSINNHPFYLRLQQYCNKSEKEDSQKEQNEANSRLEESKKAGNEADKVDDYPDFSWSSVENLPSSHMGQDASEAKDKLTDLNAEGNVNNSSARKETTKKFKESMDAATSFLDQVEQIVKGGLENLHISEYAMQMFSYYTVNKKDGKTRPDGDIINISGYKLSEHAAYQAECEYILWGDCLKTNE